MAKPQNAFLAKHDAKLQAFHEQQRRALSEVHLMAMLIAANRELKVGPGRATDYLAEYLAVKMEIAQQLLDDVGDSHKKGGDGDPEFLHTKRDLALTLKRILGAEKWKEHREFFPMLRQYWDI